MINQTATAAKATAGQAGRPHYSERYKTLVLVLLVVAYTFSFIDRTILSTIGQKIKEDLRLDDTQLGMLGGLFFALLYTVLGVPLARLAERISRVNIIAVAIVIWSGFTALCGTAGSFATLAFYRFGVGVGEAGLSPPAHSLISDYYEPKRRASALAIYSFGIPLGAMLGAVLGGQIVQHFSWRMAFVVVGLPGVLVALSIKLLIQEPPRGHSEPAAAPRLAEDVVPDEPAKPAPTLGGELREMGAVVATLFGKWPVLNVMLGVTLVSMGGYGAGQFVPPYFIRLFHLDYATTGLITGLAAGIGQGFGTLIGGFLTDRLAKAGAQWYALVPAIGITISYPIVWAVFTSADWHMAAALIVLPGIFSYTYLGPTFGVVQNMVPTRRRATATAIMFFFLNLIALGGGPPLIGWVIDHLAAYHYMNPGAPGLMASLDHFLGVDPAGFKAACPGGLAPKGAPGAAMAACAGAVGLATRQGVLIGYALGIWGALHYLIAAFGLKGALAKARAERGEAD